MTRTPSDIVPPVVAERVCAGRAALAAYDAKDDSTHEALTKTLKKLEEKREAVPDWKAIRFPAGGQSLSYARGDSLTVETTALAVLAMHKHGSFTDSVNKGLTYLIKSKDPHGTWGSTQATILSLDFANRRLVVTQLVERVVADQSELVIVGKIPVAAHREAGLRSDDTNRQNTNLPFELRLPMPPPDLGGRGYSPSYLARMVEQV